MGRVGASPTIKAHQSPDGGQRLPLGPPYSYDAARRTPVFCPTRTMSPFHRGPTGRLLRLGTGPCRRPARSCHETRQSNAGRRTGRPAAIVKRSELPAAGSADCEIVVCRMPDGAMRQLFCKFGPLAEPALPTHCFGVAYEAQVYDQLLPSWKDEVPRLARGAAGRDDPNGGPGAQTPRTAQQPLSQASQPKARADGGRTVDRPVFIAGARRRRCHPFLHRCDTGFYRAWMQRAGHFTRRLHERLVLGKWAWLPRPL